MRRILLYAACAWAGCVGAVPFAGYVYPCGLARGTTNVLIVGGQGFHGAMETAVSGRGVRVLAEENVPLSAPPTVSQRRWLDRWFVRLANGVTNAPPLPTNEQARVSEWTSNRWWRALHRRTPLERSLLLRHIHERPDPLQTSPSLRQMRLVTVAADADAACGVRSLVVCDRRSGSVSAPRPLLVTAAPHVAEPLYAPDSWLKTVTNAATRATIRARVAEAGNGVILDGTVRPGETDRFRVHLRRGRWRVRAYAASLQPIIGDAVPGYFNAAVTLEGCRCVSADRLPSHDPVSIFDIPAEGTYGVTVRDVLSRGRCDFVYALALFPEGSEEQTLEAFGRSDPFRLRFDPATGTIEETGEIPSESGPYGLYAVYSTLGLRPGQWKTLPLRIRRRPGYEAPIAVIENDLLEVRNGYVPAGTNRWNLSVRLKRRPAGVLAETDLRSVAFGRDGAAVVSTVVPADEYEQAFAWKHLLVQPRLLVKPFLGKTR